MVAQPRRIIRLLRLPYAFLILCVLCLTLSCSHAQTDYGVRVGKDSGKWETLAAQDLARVLSVMTGQKVAVNGTPARTEFLVGELALESSSSLKSRLQDVTPKGPVLRADAIAVGSEKGQVLLAGSNDDSHYTAVAWYLRQQGCRWYIPGPLGEHIPVGGELKTQGLDFAYAPPFEVRTIWISWEGSWDGIDEFAHRNLLNQERRIAGAHALGGLLPTPPEGETLSFSDPETARYVARGLAEKHAKSEYLSVSMADLVMRLASDDDRQLAGGFQDKFFDSVAVTDTLMPFYNAVCEELWRLNPESRSLLTFLAYTNLTLPPQRSIEVSKRLVAFVAPIDIDPNHGLRSGRSPERTDYYHALKRWSEVMEGRVVIYDYDQSMLVWRDLPNPSHTVVAQDMKTYRELGLMGVSTESRNATATTFLNLFFRGQLSWDPDLDLQTELDLFYQNFYGPAAPAMKSYWEAIFQAWESTEEIYHEFFIIPSIYTPELVAQLGRDLDQALVQGKAADPVVKDRLRLTELSYQVIAGYTAMVELANQGQFKQAVARGEKGLEAREQLKSLSPHYTTGIPKYEKGAPWWPGEVALYRRLAELSSRWMKMTPRDWTFRPDPHDRGIWQSWGPEPWPAELKTVRTDRLLTSQGLTDPEGFLPEGYGWFQCEIELTEQELKAGAIHLRFPGLFNTSWLYLNGSLVDWREQKSLAWQNHYDYNWDVDLSQGLRPGKNSLVLRCVLTQHASGMFRRPFLYRAAAP